MSILGTLLVVAALVNAVLATLLWAAVARTARRNGPGASATDGRFERGACRATFAALGAITAAVVILEVALLRLDTGLAYVVRVVEPEMPTYFRITSLWSALEGSLLMWLACVAMVAAVFVAFPRLPASGHATAAAVLCALVAAFAVVAMVASPFDPAEGPIGPRPSPLLQDHPAMAVHPPLLYAGFAGLAVPYALSLAGLLTRTTDRAWARLLRGWTLAAWIPLTAGIVLGAWWSYAVLGWGGYWAWDPVENASLMPWLVATALLHATHGAPTGGDRRGAGPVALAGVPFLLVLLATFLTRSGMVESIHAFSTSCLGPLLLGVLVVAVLAWLVLAVRAQTADSPEPAALLSRRTALQAGRVLLVLIAAIVLVGSVLPAIVLSTTGDRLSVGAPWYHRTLAPFALTVLVLMAIGPLLSWRGRDRRAQVARLRVPAVAAAVVLGATGFLVPDPGLALTAGIAAFVVATLVQRLLARRTRAAIGGLLAHLGVALGAVAVVASGHATVTEQTVAVGETVTAGTTTATLLGVERRDDGRRTLAQARLLLADDGALLGEAEPELRWYPQHAAMLTGPDITTGLLRDVYVTLLDVDPAEGVATVRLAVNPLIGWLWAAGGLMVLGAAVSWRRGARRTGPSTGSGIGPSTGSGIGPSTGSGIGPSTGSGIFGSLSLSKRVTQPFARLRIGPSTGSGIFGSLSLSKRVAQPFAGLGIGPSTGSGIFGSLSLSKRVTQPFAGLGIGPSTGSATEPLP